MRAVSTFCTVTVVLALLMTAIHYAVLHYMRRPLLPANDDIPEDEMTMEPTDYAAAVLPDHEKAHGDWIERARAAAQRLATERGQISSDDIWDVAPPPPGVDPRVLGAVFSDKSLWERTGYVKSARKVNHGRVIAVWSLRAS